MNSHDIRRLAMQLLYQIDLQGGGELHNIDEDFDADEVATPLDPAWLRAAEPLARAAWSRREEADRLVTELAGEWPSHRQPPLDRAILRLGYHELATDRAPARVVLNEAVELAKEYGAKESPLFVNGVLDAMARRMEKNLDGRPPAAAGDMETAPGAGE